ncbi:MAG: hypothetical protein WC485_00395 [Opitutaceae bacterium]
MNDVPKCPWCGHAKHVRMVGHRHYYCGGCRREFDGVDDGITGYGDPARHAERAERREKRKAVRR